MDYSNPLIKLSAVEVNASLGFELSTGSYCIIKPGYDCASDYKLKEIASSFVGSCILKLIVFLFNLANFSFTYKLWLRPWLIKPLLSAVFYSKSSTTN